MTIIFISLHFSALRSWARKYASTVLGPTGGEANKLYLWLAVTNVHMYSRTAQNLLLQTHQLN